MHKFVRNLLTEWRRLGLPFETSAIIVAVSGGADSLSLLLALHDLKHRRKLNLNVVVAHLNHCLRGAESDADADFVLGLAEKLGLASVVTSATISTRGNLEQNAREARYEFLVETARSNSAEIILTAHTINDQAETLLLNLLRGSGIDGLAGIKPVAEHSTVKLVRPLVNWALRADTVEFCNFREVGFRHDAMNDDPDFTRVRIRRELLPKLKEYNPRIVESLANTAKLLRFEADANASGIKFDSDDTLKIRDLKNLAEADVYVAIRRWMKARRGNLRGIGLKHFEAIKRLIESRRSGRAVELPGGEKVERRNGAVRWIRGNEENR